MKGKTALCLLLFLLLLFIPLLALGAKVPEKKAEPKPTVPAASSQAAAASSTTPQPTPTTTKKTTFPDTFRILDEGTGNVITVGDKEFLFGAVATEMSPESHVEALKAQAVSAYTYYSRLRAQQRENPDPKLNGADFKANIGNWWLYTTKEEMQKRWGSKFDTYYQTLSQVADAVYGQSLQSEGELICATYYAISSGNTEAAKDIWGGDYSYLVSVASPGDVYAGGYNSTVTLTAEQVQQKAQTEWNLSLTGNPKSWFGKTERTGSGSVITQQLGGTAVKGSEVRTAFGLRSANYTVKYDKDTFTFSVKGYGHGVGLSQVGADYMARQGSDYQKILAWYYPGTTLVKVDT